MKEKQHNNLKRIIPLIIIMALAIIVSSCVDKEPYDRECKVGTQGMRASFDSNSLRSSYEENHTYPFRVQVSNNGAYTHQVIVGIGTHIRDRARITPKYVELEVMGKNRINECRGFSEYASFEISPYFLPLGSGSYPLELGIDLCYRYNTEYSGTVCVDPNPGSTNLAGKNCNQREVRVSSGQGAPLGVVRMDPPLVTNRDGGKRINLRIYIRNYGRGNIVAHTIPNNILLACSYEMDDDRNNKVYYDFVNIKGFLDEKELECGATEIPGEPVGKTRLRSEPQTVIQNNQAVVLKDYYVNCHVDIDNFNTEREMTLNLNMSYFYEEIGTEKRTITVRKI